MLPRPSLFGPLPDILVPIFPTAAAARTAAAGGVPSRGPTGAELFLGPLTRWRLPSLPPLLLPLLLRTVVVILPVERLHTFPCPMPSSPFAILFSKVVNEKPPTLTLLLLLPEVSVAVAGATPIASITTWQSSLRPYSFVSWCRRSRAVIFLDYWPLKIAVGRGRRQRRRTSLICAAQKISRDGTGSVGATTHIITLDTESTRQGRHCSLRHVGCHDARPYRSSSFFVEG